MEENLTNEDFEKYHKFIYYVANKFRWATKPNSYIRRPIRYEEFISEGNLVLVQAWRRYDPGKKANFTTYLYHALVRAFNGVITEQCSIIRIKTPSLKGEDQQIAINCSYFSERAQARAETDHKIKWEEMWLTSPSCEGQVDNKEFITHCLKKLKKYLPSDSYQILLERSKGKTFIAMGNTRGVTKECVRLRYKAALERSRKILANEIE